MPPGIHRCTWGEAATRFGQGSPERLVETAELAEFVVWAREAGVRRLLVDGSYVTAKQTPNDVDLVILPGPDYPRQAQPAQTGTERWPFLHIQVAQDEADLLQWANVDFGLDRRGIKRGLVEIEL